MENEVVFNEPVNENQVSFGEVTNVIDNTEAKFEQAGEKAGSFINNKVVQIGGKAVLGAGLGYLAYRAGKKIYSKNKEWFDRKRTQRMNKKYIKLKKTVAPEILDEYFGVEE